MSTRAWLDALKKGDEVAMRQDRYPVKIVKVVRRTPTGRIVVGHNNGYNEMTFRGEDGREYEWRNRSAFDRMYLDQITAADREVVRMRNLRDRTIDRLDREWSSIPDAVVEELAAVLAKYDAYQDLAERGPG